MRRRSRQAARTSRRLFLVLLAAAIAVGYMTTQAFTAANIVPATNIGQFTQAITPAQLAPAECNSVAVTTIVSGSGTIRSTAAHQLVLGSGGVDTLSDGHGTSCMVGGAGADSFSGLNGGGDRCVVSAVAASIKKCTVVATRP